MRTAISPRFATRSFRIAIVADGMPQRYPAPLAAVASRSRGRRCSAARPGGRRHALRDRRARLGPRGRDEPVRRARLRRRPAGATSGSSRTTTAEPSCASSPPGRCACCSPSALAAVQISSTKPFKVVDARGKARKLKAGHAEPRRGEAERTLRLPLRYVAGGAPLQLDGTAYRGALRRPPAGREAHDRQPAAARPLPPRRRAVGDARRLAPRGASRAGGRRALLRARDAEAGRAASTSTPTRAARSTAASRPRRPRRTARSARRRAGSSTGTGASRRPSTTRPRAGGRSRTTRRGRGATPVPYLVSVADPYDCLSKLHRWGPFLLDAGGSGAGSSALGACATSSSPAGRRDARPR